MNLHVLTHSFPTRHSPYRESERRSSQWCGEFVSEFSHTAALNGLTADRACAIGRPSGKADYLITVGPLVDSVGELEHGLACAIAFVADPAETTPLSTAGLVEVGRLTPAEAEVCHHLVNGLSLSEIAERSEEHTSELQSLMRISYAVFCLKKKNNTNGK